MFGNKRKVKQVHYAADICLAEMEKALSEYGFFPDEYGIFHSGDINPDDLRAIRIAWLMGRHSMARSIKFNLSL